MKIENVERYTCSYKNTSDRFYFSKQRKFDLQYFQLYGVRLSAMRQRVIDASKRKWGNDIKVMELSDIKEGEECVVVGILFRKMELQPSILKEIAQEEGVLPLPPPEKYTSSDDYLYLEAQQQRVVLIGNIAISGSITGSVIAVRGYEDKSGKFFVIDSSYCGLPHLSCPDIDACVTKEDCYLLLTSGLGIGNPSGDYLALQVLVDLVSGKLGSEKDQSIFKRVVRLIIAGNNLSADTQDKESEKVAKYLQKHKQAKSVDAVKQLDDILMQLGSSIPVDVMPGEFDPTNQFLPQQPLHKCMFPKSFSYSTVQSVTNPYQAMVGGLRILGTSGQNIQNIYQYSCLESRLDILESTLLHGHISPTSPDTLSCYPFYIEDPFIIEHYPNVYFAGNQPKFETRLTEGNNKQKILLVCVPSFEESATLVMVNLRNLSCFPLTINTCLDF